MGVPVMLKLWGRVNSINVQKVLWALAELKVPYERTDAGLQFGVVNEPFYRRINPNGRVPTIEDDGFVLWESDWATSTVAPAITPVFWGLIRTLPEKRDPKAIEEGVEKLAQAFQVLEQGLEGRDHVAGRNFTMGDIPLGTFVYRWHALEVKRPKLPGVEAYYERLRQRAPYQKHVMLPLS